LLMTMKTYEKRHTCMSELEETISENLAKEHRSQEQLLALWKDRPRLAKQEIPTEIFQILQKQHSEEDNTALY
jgi:hypothetical protein